MEKKNNCDVSKQQKLSMYGGYKTPIICHNILIKL